MFVVAEGSTERLRVRARELRGERTLTDAAAAVGIRQDELGKIERGETTAIRFDTLLRLCAAYQVGVGDLLTVEPVEPEPAGLLGQVLAGVHEGTITTDRPIRSRRRAVSDEELYMDLGEAAAVLAPHEDPGPPRARRRVPGVSVASH
jgi:DNA-binding Xre family transcriptional regulator